MFSTWKTTPINSKPRVDVCSNTAFEYCCLNSKLFLYWLDQDKASNSTITFSLRTHVFLCLQKILSYYISKFLLSYLLHFFFSGNSIKYILEPLHPYSISHTYSFIFYFTSSMTLFPFLIVYCLFFIVTALLGTREGYISLWIHSAVFTAVSAKLLLIYPNQAIKHTTWKVCPVSLHLLRHWGK